MGIRSIAFGLRGAPQKPASKANPMEQRMAPLTTAARPTGGDPLDTRKWIGMGIEAASQAPAAQVINMRVLQK